MIALKQKIDGDVLKTNAPAAKTGAGSNPHHPGHKSLDE